MTSPAEFRSLAGRLLVARSDLRDPNFDRAVILICEHTPQGAFGLVLNQPTRHLLASALGGVVAGLETCSDALHRGGPVQPEAVFYLHDRPETEEVTAAPGVAFGGDVSGLEALLAALAGDSPPRRRFFLGYSGWGAGQLDGEMRQEAWIDAPATPDLVFEPAEERLWARVLESLGGRWALMARTPRDPGLN
ncbi:MAG: YqgE/AlgH family protein [Planctomycetota bacterium]